MKLSLEKHKLSNILFLTAIFAFSVSLFNKGGYIFAAIIVFFLLSNVKNIKISIPEILLVAFSVFYYVFYVASFGFDIKDVVIYLLGPCAAFLIGKIYVKRSEGDSEFWTLIIVVSLGMFLHGILNFVAYLRSEYLSMYDFQRIAVDFWRGDLTSVTVTGMFYTFATGISLGVLFSKVSRKYKIIAAVCLAVALVLTAFFANRTLIAMVLLILCYKIFSLFFSNKVSSKSKTLVIVSLILVFCSVIFAFATNVGGFRDWFFSLKIVQRYSDPIGRFEAWAVFFKDGNWLRYMFGGKNISSNYLHNLWLDIYNVAGIFPFVFFLCFSVYAIKRFFDFRSMMIKEHLSSYTVFQGLMLAVIINCMVEPIIEANPYYFLMILIFAGAMEGYIEKEKTRNLRA